MNQAGEECADAWVQAPGHGGRAVFGASFFSGVFAGSDAAEGFYRVVEASYEKRSLEISSNIHPSGFDELMPKTIVTATVDRLMHHAHLCQTSGESVRLMPAQNGKGTRPMK